LSFGDPRVGDLSYSRAMVDLPVTRPKGTYALKLLVPMPLVALQLTSYSSLSEMNYLLPPRQALHPLPRRGRDVCFAIAAATFVESLA
jgi:hypothetical protein